MSYSRDALCVKAFLESKGFRFNVSTPPSRILVSKLLEIGAIKSDCRIVKKQRRTIISSFARNNNLLTGHEQRKNSKPDKKKIALFQDFYATKEWRALRYKALKINGGKCQCCGRSPSRHGIVLHVDHIKPKSKFPELALDLRNLQVLCEECNLGKSNHDCIDWRPNHLRVVNE